ncbi:hypothetical protein [Streptomyces caniferus]|nr:hypothetical protein [Streptomyces caniferus]
MRITALRNAISGTVLDNPAAADCGVRQWDGAAGEKGQVAPHPR